MFEWCSVQQQIIVGYAEDMLMLISIRHNDTGTHYTLHTTHYTLHTTHYTAWNVLPLFRSFIPSSKGRYVPYAEMVESANKSGIPVVKAWEGITIV